MCIGMEKVLIHKTEKLHKSTSLLYLLFNTAVILMFTNLHRLNNLVVINIMILILISIFTSLLFAGEKLSAKNFSKVNYFFIVPALAGTILQIAL